MLHIIVLLFLFGWAQAASDPRIYDVRQITSFGENSFPMFSPDGRFILFQSKAKEYGTSCSRVYKVDLNNLKEEPISLYSSGIGDEFRPTAFERYYRETNSFVTTNTHWLKGLYNNKNQSITADGFCTKSKCDSPTDPDLQKACTSDILAYTEHYDFTTITPYNYDGILYDRLSMTSDKANSWMNPPTRINTDGYVGSGSCTRGECLFYDYYVGGKTEAPINKNGAVFDGFSFNPYSKYNPNKYFLFHGYIATEQWKQRAIKQGVVPNAGSKIFRATFKQITNGEVPDQFASKDKFTYLFPQPTNNERQAIASGIDPDTKKAAIYLLELDKDPILLSDPSVNSYHAILDPTGQYIAFVSDRDGKPLIYLGKYLDANIADPSYYPSPPTKSKTYIIKSFKNTLCYSNPSDKSNLNKYRWSKLDNKGKLMYITSHYNYKCPQIFDPTKVKMFPIFIVDTSKNDTSVSRKISTGFHVYNSPSFIKGNDDIIFASTLTHTYTDQAKLNDCHDYVCSGYNPDKDKYPLSDLCNKVFKEKPLPSDMEIYISNKYGVIKQRLTFHEGFDGEVAVSPDGKIVVYSSFTGQDYELFQMNIDGTNKKRITNALGFEGGVTFSPDGKLIAYYASRPTTSDEVNNYRQMMKFDFTDIARTQLFVYSFDTGKEYQISSLQRLSSHSPAFMQKGSDGWSYRLVFIADSGAKDFNSINVYLYGALFNAPKGSQIESRVVLIEDFYTKLWDLNIQGDSLAFATDYDICVVDKFDPDFSSAFRFEASFPLVILVVLIFKFV